jgi:hypothetical protein
VGLFVPSRASGWLRRRVIVRRGATAPGTSESQDVPYSPPYLGSDPAIMASQLPEEAEQADRAAAARAAAAPDDTLPDRPVGQASAARVRRSPAAAVLHDLFND